MVYMLDWGEQVDDPPFSGRLAFADPRLAECCSMEADRVTREVVPEMKDGALCIFPSDLVHFVHPYWGKARPRITLAWNFKFIHG